MHIFQQFIRTSLLRFYRWVFNLRVANQDSHDETLDTLRLTVFILFHMVCLAAFFVGISIVVVCAMLFFYLIRMFFITAFYHRYFSHRAYRVSRPTQFFMAVAGCTAGQRGPVWWASHHRHHHVNSDRVDDPHSPKNGLLNSHMLWFLRRNNFPVIENRVRDWLRYPELKWLEYVDWLPFILFGVGCYLLGHYLSLYFPGLNTSAGQMLVWGFFISTVLLYHGTYTINSLAHKFGKRRYATRDDSRNNLLLAIITLGEGWHNNHHRYPNAARQGFFWWEIDISYFLLWCLQQVGIVKSLQPVPLSILQEAERH